MYQEIPCAAAIFMGHPDRPPEKLRCHHVWIVEWPTWVHDLRSFDGEVVHCAPLDRVGTLVDFVAWSLGKSPR